MKNRIFIFFLSLSLLVTSFFSITAYASVSSYRLYGQNRYETSSKIADEYYNCCTTNNVILVTGEDYPDALSASVLAHKVDAPILLADSTAGGSSNAFDYIARHLDKSGNIYIIGSDAVNDNFTSYLNQMGYKNIIKVGDNDRYNTNCLVARQLNAPVGTPVVISSGENFPDALGISSYAAHNNWPILLVPDNTIPDKTVQFLLSDKPSKVYITGGTGVITSKVEEQIKGLVPEAEIVRFAGQDRFDTNAQIIQAFAANTRNLFLASGYGFADALSGSVLAALDGEPIVLVDPAADTVPAGAAQLLTNFKGIFQNVVSFGGTAVVPESVAEDAIDIISGKNTDNNTSLDSIEKRIKDALINKTTCLFKISDEYTFMPGVEGYKTFSDEKGTTKYKQTAEWAQNDIKGSSSGFIIRIDEGIASMEDSTNYTCSLKINGNDEGVSLSIDHVKSGNYAVHINGTVKGNTLTATEQVSTAYYSPYTKSGFGTSSSGQYCVGLVNIPEEQWPPLPVTLSYSVNSDKSVTLTWKDKNPSTLIGYYEIYREVDVADKYTKIATVSNRTTWTDSSNEVSDSFTFSLSYIVVAYSKTGIKSPDSNYVLYFPSNW